VQADIEFEARLQRDAMRFGDRGVFGKPLRRVDQPLRAGGGLRPGLVDHAGEFGGGQGLAHQHVGIGVKRQQLQQHLGAEHHHPPAAHAVQHVFDEAGAAATWRPRAAAVSRHRPRRGWP
jgi:hypothetical protein